MEKYLVGAAEHAKQQPQFLAQAAHASAHAALNQQIRARQKLIHTQALRRLAQLTQSDNKSLGKGHGAANPARFADNENLMNHPPGAPSSLAIWRIEKFRGLLEPQERTQLHRRELEKKRADRKMSQSRLRRMDTDGDLLADSLAEASDSEDGLGGGEADGDAALHPLAREREERREHSTLRTEAHYGLLQSTPAAVHEIAAKCERQMQASGRYYPDDIAPRAWHLIVGVACLVGLLRESYMCGFGHPFGGGALFLTYLLDALLIADIYVEMGLAVEASNGSVTFDRAEIWKQYRRGWFLWDTALVVPVELLGFVWGGPHDTQWYRLLLCLRVWLRVVKLRKVYTFYRDFLRDDNAVVNVNRLGALLVLIVLAVHWTACFWFVVCEMQDYKADGGDTGTAHFALDPDNWITRHGLQDMPPNDRYVAALYSVTMMLLGENVDPQTYTERVLACLLALLGALALASIFSSVADVWMALGLGRGQFTEQLARVNDRMSSMRLPGGLQSRIRQYYTHLWRRDRSFEDDDELLQNLSLSLATEVKLHQHSEVVLRVPLVALMDTHVVEAIVLELESHVYLPGDFVPHDDSLYYVATGLFKHRDDHGSGALSPRPSPRGHAQVKFIGKGDHFGEEALLEQRHRVETVRALGSSDLTVLSQAAFARVEELFPVALACARRLLRDLPKLEEQHPDVVAGFEDDRSLDFLEMDAGQRRLVRSVRLLRRAGIGAEEDAALVHASEFGGEPAAEAEARAAAVPDDEVARVLFEVVDVDNSGYIDRQELEMALRGDQKAIALAKTHSWLQPLLKPGTFAAAFDEIDADDSGTLTF